MPGVHKKITEARFRYLSYTDRLRYPCYLMSSKACKRVRTREVEFFQDTEDDGRMLLTTIQLPLSIDLLRAREG